MKETLRKLIRSVLMPLLAVMQLSAAAQDPTLDSMRASFHFFDDHRYIERIFLHTDRSFYMTGEIVWYKLYVLNGKTHRLSDLSKIAYLEVLDEKNIPVLQQTIKVIDGNGNGSIYLPLTLSTGNYTVRAYTQWMRNSGPEWFYQQPISIANLVQSERPNAVADSDLTIEFFPEGGHLVSGLPNSLGIKVTDGEGNGESFSGAIVNSLGDTVEKFSSFKFGMAKVSFDALPAPVKYQAVLIIDNKVHELSLPEMLPKGVVLRISRHERSVQINAFSNLDSDLPYVYLLINDRQELKRAERLTFRNGKAELSLDSAEWSDGISTITLFDREKNPLAERLYFTPPQNGLAIKVNLSKAKFFTRDSVALEVRAIDVRDSTSNASLSMAVFRIDSLGTLPSGIISNYWLSPEIKGHVESPEFYFQHTKESSIAADNLMVIQGWRKFIWSQVFGIGKTNSGFLPEHEGKIITAHLRDTAAAHSLNHAQVLLSVPGKNFSIHTGEILSDGSLRFVVGDIYASAHLVFTMNSSRPGGLDLTVDDPYDNRYMTSPARSWRLSKEKEFELVDRTVATQVQNIYSKDQLNRFHKPNRDQMPFYGNPTKSYRLDDYTRFPTINEVLSEYVPEVAVRRNQGTYILKILKNAVEGYLPGDPLVLVDGIPVKSMDKLFSIDPLKIEMLKTVNEESIIGRTSYPGVVSLTGYDNSYDWLELDPQALRVKYEGLQAQRLFYSPSYPSRKGLESDHPDFRTLLFWTSDVKIKNSPAFVHFYTSDLPGKYVGIIQGVGSSGEMGRTLFEFEVVKEKAK